MKSFKVIILVLSAEENYLHYFMKGVLDHFHSSDRSEISTIASSSVGCPCDIFITGFQGKHALEFHKNLFEKLYLSKIDCNDTFSLRLMLFTAAA